MRHGENSYFYRQTPEKVSFSAAAAQAMAAAGPVVRMDLGGPDKADPELEQIDQAGRSAKARRSHSEWVVISPSKATQSSSGQRRSMSYNRFSSFFPQGASAESTLTEQMRKLTTVEGQVSRPSKPPFPDAEAVLLVESSMTLGNRFSS